MIKAPKILIFLVLLLTGLNACGRKPTTASLTIAATSARSEQVALGELLFFDISLSEPKGVSCASCHQPGKAFSGNNRSAIPAVSAGAVAGVFGNRNAPTAMYAHFSPAFSFLAEMAADNTVTYAPNGGQFWDGRADSLAAQAKGPLLNPKEMNNPSKASVVAKVAQASYAARFALQYGAGIFTNTDLAFDRIAEAIEAYETAELSPFAAKFDAVLHGDASFSPAEARGFALFKDPQKGNCLACHAGSVDSTESKDWLFTDFSYDSLGVPRNAEIPANRDASFFDLGLCQQEGIRAKAPASFDLDSVCGAFKVPTLRNVAVTAPYMHNGYFKSLEEVVRFYVTRDTDPERWYPVSAAGKVQKFNDLPSAYRGNVNIDEVPYDRKPREKPRLNDAEIRDVVAFLRTLTDQAR